MLVHRARERKRQRMDDASASSTSRAMVCCTTMVGALGASLALAGGSVVAQMGRQAGVTSTSRSSRGGDSVVGICGYLVVVGVACSFGYLACRKVRMELCVSCGVERWWWSQIPSLSRSGRLEEKEKERERDMGNIHMYARTFIDIDIDICTDSFSFKNSVRRVVSYALCATVQIIEVEIWGDDDVDVVEDWQQQDGRRC